MNIKKANIILGVVCVLLAPFAVYIDWNRGEVVQSVLTVLTALFIALMLVGEYKIGVSGKSSLQ